MVNERLTGENFTGIYFGPTAATNYTYGVSNLQEFVAETSYTLTYSTHPIRIFQQGF